jgi:hypothetical protein
MGNVLERTKQEQVIALGRLGWSLRKIEGATGVRRETAGGYLRSAGIAIRTRGSWGRKAPATAALSVTGSDSSKPANEVITGFLPEARLPEQGGKRPCAASEAYRELIELELSRGRNAMGIWRLWREWHNCQNAEFGPMPSGRYLSREVPVASPVPRAIQRFNGAPIKWIVIFHSA